MQRNGQKNYSISNPTAMKVKEAEEYLIDTIKKWLNEFKGISVKFVYEESSDYYIVVVTPESIFKDEAFKKAVYRAWNEFGHKFEDSDLLISEIDPSYNMSNVLFDSIHF